MPRFSKGQALGNDYAVIDRADLTGALETGHVRGFCDRHRGVGTDGILLGDVARRPFGLRIYNPDGSEAEKSGNGLRIFGAWLHGRGLVADDEPFRVELPKDEVEMRIVGRLAAGALDIVAAMGRPSFEPDDAGFVAARALGEAGDRMWRVAADDGEADIHPVSLANPHCVVIVEALEREDFLARAPRLCTHASFPRGTNVQFARVAGPAELEAWIWERGVGETLASGSSACAVAAVARKLGLVQDGPLTVRMRGGEVRIEPDDSGMLHLRGPAQIVFDGEVPEAVWQGWGDSGG